MTTRFLFGGANGSGKSTLVCSLYVALRLAGHRVTLVEIDPWSDTHDVILGRKPAHLRNQRSEVPVDDFEHRVEQFVTARSDIVLGDMQGRWQYEHNTLLKGSADHGILISREPTAKDAATEHPQSTRDWESLFGRLDVPISQRVHSLLYDQMPTNQSDDMLLICGLDRSLVPYHPIIQKLRVWIETIT